MKKDTDTMLTIYQVRRQLAKAREELVRDVETQRGIGPVLGEPIYRAVDALEAADYSLEWMLDRLEGYAPDDVDEDGKPYPDDELLEVTIDELRDALHDLDQFNKKNEIVIRTKGLLIVSMNWISDLTEVTA